MAFCSSCGSRLDDDVRFCTECGAPVPSQQGSSSDDEALSSATTSFAPGVSVDAVPPNAMPDLNVSESASHESGLAGQKGIPSKAVIGIIVAAIVVVFIVILGVALASSSSEEGSSAQESASSVETVVTMPNLDAMTEENAVAVLDALGLTWNIEYIDDAEELVLEQFPESGAEISVGEEVTLAVGNGKSSITSQMGKARTVVLTVVNPRNGQSVSADIRLNSNDDVIPDLLTRQYTADEIRAMGLSDAELYIARNSIVAKSGYIFHYEPNTQFFIDNCAWYNPSSSEYRLQGVGAVNAGVIREVEASHGSWYLEIK